MKFALKNKISLSVILIMIVLGFVTALSVFYYTENILAENKREELVYEVNKFSNELGQIFKYSQMTAETIATQREVIDYFTVAENNFQQIDILSLLKKYNIGNIYSAIYLMAPDGTTLVSTNPSFVGKNYGFRPYFKQAYNGQASMDVVLGVTSKKLGYYFANPVKLNNKIIGVVVVKMNPEFIHNNLKLLDYSSGSHIMLVDTYGIVIYSDETDRIYKSLGNLSSKIKQKIIQDKRFSGISITALPYQIIQDNLDNIKFNDFEFYDKDDKTKEFLTATKIKNSPFYLVIESNIASYINSAKQISYLIGFIVFLFALLAGFLIYLLIGNFLKPLENLYNFASQVTAGNLSVHIDPITTSKELDELAHAFNKMLLSIKTSQKEINKKVIQQTHEIVKNTQHLKDQQKAILNVLEDVEAEKDRTAVEKDKIAAVLHSIGDAVFVVDKNLKITMINEIAINLGGYKNIHQAIGKKYNQVLKFVYEKNEQKNEEFIKKVMRTGEIQEMSNHTLLVNSRLNKNIPVADSAAPIKNKKNEVIGCVVVFRDVTQERAIDQAKTEFVSLASHQLRTPLSSINWYAEMLLAGDAGKLNKEQKEYIAEIYKGNQRMVDLVNALLNVSRLELGTFAVNPEQTVIHYIADSVLNELKGKIKQKHQTVKKFYDKKLPKIKVDTKLLRIIFQNLLSNAVKYSPNKGKITLKIEKLEEFVLIQVTDNGMGIPREQQNKVFSKLFRADNVRESDTQGTGLGLYIIKSILDNTGGSISFESVEKVGTSFSVFIPLSGMQAKTGTKKLN